MFSNNAGDNTAKTVANDDEALQVDIPKAAHTLDYEGGIVTNSVHVSRRVWNIIAACPSAPINTAHIHWL